MPLLDWDFLRSHVDAGTLPDNANTGVRGQNYFSGESSILCAGPATLSELTDIAGLYPIGTTDAIQLANSTNVVQLWEIGSKVPYLVRGHTVTQMNLSKVLFNGDSLLAALTKGIDADGGAIVEYGNAVIGSPGGRFAKVPGDTGNSGRFYLNLASQFFNQPFGLCLLFKDSKNHWVSAFYAENCIIQNDSIAIQGQNMLIMETASIRTTGLVPFDLLPSN